MSAGVAEVARPKAKAGGKAKAKGAAPPKARTIGVRATGEWAEWIERAARHCRTDVAKLIDVAVAEYVKAKGFDEPPPERIS